MKHGKNEKKQEFHKEHGDTVPFSDHGVSHARRHVLRGLSLLLLYPAILGGMGAFVYGLYSIAARNRSVYGIVFYIAFGGLVLFFVLKAIRNGAIRRVLLKIAIVLIKLTLVLFCISAVMLYAAFVIRHPVIGASLTPVAGALLFIVFKRLKIAFALRKYFYYLQHRY